MATFLQIFTLFGALAMFLYGMTLTSEGLQKAAGEKLRSFLETMTSTKIKRILTGVLITVLIQSSSGTTVMVVSMVNSGLLSLANGIGVIMGANIGTTITAWLISLFGFSFQITDFAIPFLALGFVFTLSKKSKRKSIGQFIIGFALLIYGLGLLKEAVPDLNAHPEILAFVKNLTGYKFLSVLIFLIIGTVLTIVLQASSATMALTMVFVSNGWINFEMAAAMVLGENIGTTITANIAASIANHSARRSALAHTFFNVFGVIWVLILYKPFLNLVGFLVSSMGLPNPLTSLNNLAIDGEVSPVLQNSLLFGVCTLHSLFNITNTLILIWFIPFIEKFVTWMVPNPKGEEIFRLQFIQGGTLSTAELSLDEAKQEIIHFGKICYKGFDYIKEALNEKNLNNFELLYEKLIKYEQITDRIEYEIASYLNEVAKGKISEESANRIRAMYRIVGEMESLGDSGENIGKMLKRTYSHNKCFSEDMLKKINKMLDLLNVAYREMIKNLCTPYREIKNINNAHNAEHEINEYRNIIREAHIVSIEKENYDYQTGVFFMDVISELERMGDFIINISESQIIKHER